MTFPNSKVVTYTYDNAGNRATMVDSTGTTTYTYNVGNRLTLITDPSSNLTTNTYDNNGNLTVSNANGTVTTNTWTYENRLRTVTLATPATTTFTYDGDGLRRQTVTAAGTTNFIWDGQDVLLETDVSNNTQVTYTQTPDEYGALVSQRRSTTTSFHHHDALGSTLALTDTNENVTDTYKYYAFGGSLTNSGATVNNLRFVGNLGYYNESALSLQYLRARYYQPSTGRFVSVDPKRDGVNWYLYAHSRPTLSTDPSGLYELLKSCKKKDESKIWNSLRGAWLTWLPDVIGQIENEVGYRVDMSCVRDALGGSATTDVKIGCGGAWCKCANSRFLYGRTGNVLCGWWVFYASGPAFQLCGPAFDSPKCDSPACVILHEAIHACGGGAGHSAHDEVADSITRHCPHLFPADEEPEVRWGTE